MPRRSGTDVLFPKWTRPAVFLPGAFCFSDAVLSVPVCGTLLLSPCAVSSSSACIGCRPRLCPVAALALCRAAVPPCAVSSSSACIGCRPRLCRVAAPICVALSSAVCVVSPSSVCGWPPPENSADGLAGNLCGLRGSCGLSLRCGDSGRVARPLFCSS